MLKKIIAYFNRIAAAIEDDWADNQW